MSATLEMIENKVTNLLNSSRKDSTRLDELESRMGDMSAALLDIEQGQASHVYGATARGSSGHSEFNNAMAQAYQAGGIAKVAAPKAAATTGGASKPGGGTGSAIPEQMGAFTFAALNESPLFANVRKEAAYSNNYVELLSIGGAGAVRSAEDTERSDTSAPSLQRIEVVCRSLSATPAITNELAASSTFGWQSWLENEAAQAFGNTLEAEILNGDPAQNEFEGILTRGFDDYTPAIHGKHHAKYAALTGGAGETLADLLVAMTGALHYRYKTGAKFYLNPETVAMLRGIKDSQGQYILSIVEGAQRILGYELVEVVGLPKSAAGEAGPSVLFGNLPRAYLVAENRNAQPVVVDTVTTKGYTKLFVESFLGGTPADCAALIGGQLGA